VRLFERVTRATPGVDGSDGNKKALVQVARGQRTLDVESALR
jgi:hypothetical protein